MSQRLLFALSTRVFPWPLCSN